MVVFKHLGKTDQASLLNNLGSVPLVLSPTLAYNAVIQKMSVHVFRFYSTLGDPALYSS